MSTKTSTKTVAKGGGSRSRRRQMADIAERLRQLRAAMGKTQGELAELLGTTLNNYGRWEREERLISRPTLLLVEQLEGTHLHRENVT